MPLGNLVAMNKATLQTPKVDSHVNAGLIEIFRAGKHTDMKGNTREFTEADIKGMAESYDASASEAPLVVGHPVLNAPAYGWTKRLVADGPLLLAEPNQVESQFAELVNAGRFKKISASFMLPDAKDNPKPGNYYLRHIGFLGAAAPAVKGLRDCSFADEGECTEFAYDVQRFSFDSIGRIFRNLRDWLIETNDKDTADKLIPDYYITEIQDAARPPSDAALSNAFAAPGIADISEDNTVTQQNAEFAERETALANKQKELDDRQAAIDATEAAARRTANVEFADSLVTAGKLLPKDKDRVVELLMAFPKDQSLSFAEGDATVEQGADEVLRNLLNAMPKQIDFSEKSGGDKAPIDFADSNAIAVAANEFQSAERAAGREVSTAQAVQHITKGNK